MSSPPGSFDLLIPAPDKIVLRCLADVQKIEVSDGEHFTPPMRFLLVQERLAQKADQN